MKTLAVDEVLGFRYQVSGKSAECELHSTLLADGSTLEQSDTAKLTDEGFTATRKQKVIIALTFPEP